MNFTRLLRSEDTAEWAKRAIAGMSSYPYLADIVIVVLGLVIGALFTVLIFYVLRQLVYRYWLDRSAMSKERRHYLRNICICLASCLPLYAVAYSTWVDGIHEWVAILVRELMEGAIVVALSLAISNGIWSFGLWYKQQRNAAQRPIDGLLKVAVGFVWAAGFILFFSVVLNKSPFYLLSGLGAIAAAWLLFFQQSIHSLAASLQLNADRLVEMGDWISLDSGTVDGMVEEISLHTVKVRNWDQTVVCLPVCDLVKKPFVNYTAMEKNGGRRIKKSILIDQRSVRFLTKEEVKELKDFDVLKDYLRGKEEEIGQYNTGRSRFDARHLSNLGTFRVYVRHYLERHPGIRQDMTLMVRIREPSSAGVPLEIYCFSKEVSWIPYEAIQSGILEHLLSVMPNFSLRVFQQCSDIYQEVGSHVDRIGGALRSSPVDKDP